MRRACMTICIAQCPSADTSFYYNCMLGLVIRLFRTLVHFDWLGWHVAAKLTYGDFLKCVFRWDPILRCPMKATTRRANMRRKVARFYRWHSISRQCTKVDSLAVFL